MIVRSSTNGSNKFSKIINNVTRVTFLKIYSQIYMTEINTDLMAIDATRVLHQN